MKLLPLTLLFSSLAFFVVSCGSTPVTNRNFNNGYQYRSGPRSFQTAEDGWNVGQSGGNTRVSFTN
ncbi:MAG TPA: hypothetical protein PK529_12930 [Verrucomicrobiales bacterium]|nr:hypothetical protein [Verrucomicrobiales bacterium]MBP9224073.1 hypothetical protein [Verrucomicrobiales bacterium]HQW30088.1 hypothetical protein [Verrucomicrobiales bacterium]HQZ28174.1 hypothetical protein [Verrucomicrobiales bacterium]